MKYEIRIMDPLGEDVANDNVDVCVEFDDGDRYFATFFTLRNIESLMAKNRRTGEDGGGIYFWALKMIVVERIDMLLIEKAVADLLETEFFVQAFDGPFRVDPDSDGGE
jgi:hypothetical protein